MHRTLRTNSTIKKFLPISIVSFPTRWNPGILVPKITKTRAFISNFNFNPALNSKLQDRELQRVQIARDISTSDFGQRVNAAKYITLTFHISMENLIRPGGLTRLSTATFDIREKNLSPSRRFIPPRVIVVTSPRGSRGALASIVMLSIHPAAVTATSPRYRLVSREAGCALAPI